jgi:DNA-binding response OmpR family regulator
VGRDIFSLLLDNPDHLFSDAGSLASFESDRPAAVLLDVDLPDGSGLDALREIKTRQPQAVVIMITANVIVEDTLAALRVCFGRTAGMRRLAGADCP